MKKGLQRPSLLTRQPLRRFPLGGSRHGSHCCRRRRRMRPGQHRTREPSPVIPFCGPRSTRDRLGRLFEAASRADGPSDLHGARLLHRAADQRCRCVPSTLDLARLVRLVRIKILRALAPALKPGVRILINEAVMPEPGVLSPFDERSIRDFDMTMWHYQNGKEREAGEWKKLFQEAGTRFDMVGMTHPPGSALSIIEVVWRGS
jgi:O-methyltransferase domain